jgi:hypothetical protein
VLLKRSESAPDALGVLYMNHQETKFPCCPSQTDTTNCRDTIVSKSQSAGRGELDDDEAKQSNERPHHACFEHESKPEETQVPGEYMTCGSKQLIVLAGPKL